MLLILWLLFSIGAGVIASNKGRSGAGFFLLSLLLSPLIGVFAALIAKRNEENIAQKTGERKCQFCAEFVKKEAVVCKHCRSDLVESN